MVTREQNDRQIASVKDLAKAYGVDEQTMQVRIYALAEQIHTHYCFSKGPVNHSESRPDEHVAAGILGSLVAGGWWLVKADECIAPQKDDLEYELNRLGDEGLVND